MGVWPLLLTMLASSASGQTVELSPDITMMVDVGTYASDETVFEVGPGSMIGLMDLGPVPAQVEITGYHRDSEGLLFAIDSTAQLPRVGVDLIAEPRDLIIRAANDYALVLDGSAFGIPQGAGIDAVSTYGSYLLISFDTTVDLGGGLIAADEDLVIVEGGGTFALLLDASELGIDPALDLDAVHFVDEDLLVSFDGPGEVDGFTFFDEDILLLDSAGWSLFLQGAGLNSELVPGDVSAFSVPP